MYQVLHARKIKTEVGLLNVAKHNDRSAYAEKDRPEWQNENYDKTLEKLPSNDVLSDRESRIKSANLLRKPQKNASAAIEFFISADRDFSRDNKKWADYFSDSIKFFEKKFGKENLIQAAIHTDESTPHMHLVFVPIARTAKGNKYTSSEYLGGRVGMQKMHTEFYEAVGKKYGLERGEENSRASHGDARDFNRQKKIITESTKHVKNNSLDFFDLYKKYRETKSESVLNKLLSAAKKSITGAWELVKKTREQAEKLKAENDRLKKMTPQEFEQFQLQQHSRRSSRRPQNKRDDYGIER